MKIDTRTTPQQALSELAARITQRRIELGLTQAEAAQRAGVGKRTIERIEAGGDTQLSTLIRLLRILDLSDRLDLLIPESTVSPMEMLKRQSARPKRAPRKKSTDVKESKKPWTWGDER
ncbi:MAG: helix-turn-helix domain-containing protein [Pirellulales bacterium]|nr:helix-turn-helix domain-containing protein [Pirellulales bacterium]